MSNSSFSPTSTVMLRNIPLAYKYHNTGITLGTEGRLTCINIFSLVLVVIFCVFYNTFQSNSGHPYTDTSTTYLIEIFMFTSYTTCITMY